MVSSRLDENQPIFWTGLSNERVLRSLGQVPTQVSLLRSRHQTFFIILVFIALYFLVCMKLLGSTPACFACQPCLAQPCGPAHPPPLSYRPNWLQEFAVFEFQPQIDVNSEYSGTLAGFLFVEATKMD